MSGKKDLHEVIRRAQEQGWTVEYQRRGGHIKFVPPNPDKGVYYASATPGDYRGLRNMISELRRRGYVHSRGARRHTVAAR